MPPHLLRRRAVPADLDALIDLRLIALRPSLEKLGRFNPARARQRFIDEFAPEHTTVLSENNRVVGCFALLPKEDHFYLAHLYLLPDYQGQGIGQSIVKEMQRRAVEAGKDIHLIALNQSPAEQFYARLGFVAVDRTDIDVQLVYRVQGQSAMKTEFDGY